MKININQTTDLSVGSCFVYSNFILPEDRLLNYCIFNLFDF